ncbi:hypothetical protein SAY86_009655 [Trapa natans]|uniref:RING-type E3 ubiquitin transferase n=1 Tax=Trapa natans TaxID=22666 RepID=A0AAN7KX90_TRANT|nr:hypothetical protein SAY86_009655 [Trapa natans]
MSFSFAGNSVGGPFPGDGSSFKPFYCHQCTRTVNVSVSPSTDPICPHCNGGFLEEYEESVQPPFQLSDPFSSVLSYLTPSSSSTATAFGDIQNPSLSSNRNSASSASEENPFDPVAFLQGHLQNLNSSGAQIQVLVDSRPPSHAQFRLPVSFGDYFFGPGLEQLIQQLAENDPNRYGTPPASKSAVEALPMVRITDEILSSEMNQCAVCQDEFEKDTEVKQMPCKHIYHSDCLLPWLELHSSCPVCRHELPTDDADTEGSNRTGAQGQGSNPGGSDSQRSGNARITPRRFSILLPDFFRGGGGEGGNEGGLNSSSGRHELPDDADPDGSSRTGAQGQGSNPGGSDSQRSGNARITPRRFSILLPNFFRGGGGEGGNQGGLNSSSGRHELPDDADPDGSSRTGAQGQGSNPGGSDSQSGGNNRPTPGETSIWSLPASLSWLRIVRMMGQTFCLVVLVIDDAVLALMLGKRGSNMIGRSDLAVNWIFTDAVLFSLFVERKGHGFTVT